MPARARTGIMALFKGLLAIWLLAVATPASAQEAQLRRDLSVTAASETGWTWLELRDPQALREMPAGWQLLIDQVRFEKIAVKVTAADGSVQRQELGADQLEGNWAPGGLLKFEIA